MVEIRPIIRRLIIMSLRMKLSNVLEQG